jgi:hypothetical protein
MARLGVLFGPLVLVLWIFCVVDVITTRDGGARHLPKWGWLILVLLFPLVGSVAWLVAGRPRRRARRSRLSERPAPEFPEYDRPGRAASPKLESDEEFLRRCRERAEEQRRRFAERQGDDPDADDASA